jgi:hypothetical protein
MPISASTMMISGVENPLIQDVMSQIKTQVLQGIAQYEEHHFQCQSQPALRSRYTATFTTTWIVAECFKFEPGDPATLSFQSFIAIIGGEVNAQATTCAQYLQQTWPSTGLSTWSALCEAMANHDGQYCQGILRRTQDGDVLIINSISR